MSDIRLYREYLVSYDIQDTKIRNKLFDALKDVGLKPVQKSVFWGWLSLPEYTMVKRLFRDRLKKADSAFIVPCKLSQQADDALYNMILPKEDRPDGYGIL